MRIPPADSGHEIREEEKEQDQGDDEQIHVEAEENASVVEAPTALHAACGVDGTGDDAKCGQKLPQGGAQVRGVSEQDRNAQTDEDEDVGPNQRMSTRVEEVIHKAISLVLCGIGWRYWSCGRQLADG
jgi:hypothetical protein